jgi:hypothetical protein
LPADLHVDELRFGDEAAERDVLIAVHLRVFWPISPISATQEPRVILGFRDGARGLRTTQTALSGHVWRRPIEKPLYPAAAPRQHSFR